MDWLSFIVGLVGAIAWPGAILILVLLFHKELRPLIQSLRKFSWGDKTLEFDKGLDEAEDRAKELPPPPATLALPAPAESEQRFEAALEISPELAVVEAWLSIERELQVLAAKRGYTAGRARSVTFLMRRLASDGAINPATEKLINELRNLRDIALHRSPGPTLSIEDVRRYKELAETATDILRRVSLQ